MILIKIAFLMFTTLFSSFLFAEPWDIPVDNINLNPPMPPEDLLDSFSNNNRGRFGPTLCPNKSEVFSLNIMADYSGSLRELSGTKDDMSVFKTMSGLISNVQGSRNLSMDNNITKENFINYLTQFSKGKKFINLNFAGHGEIIEGKAYLILPGYFNCLRKYQPNKGKITEACGTYLVTGREVEKSLSGSHVFGLMSSCVSGDIIRDMPGTSMIAASEPGRDILDNYGQFSEGLKAAELENKFSGSELAGRVNDLLKNKYYAQLLFLEMAKLHLLIFQQFYPKLNS